MTELFAGPSTAFLEHATQNRIARILQDAFFELQGFMPSDSEVRSWRNSLRALSNAIASGGFTDHGILLEYQLPLTSMRIDAMITGLDHDGREAAVIVELKQWDDCDASVVPECVGVRYAGRIVDQLHPSAQARQYRMYLADTHSEFQDGGVRLGACAFLHDFAYDDQSELLSPRHANILGIYPLFAGDRVDELVQFLDDRIGGGHGLATLTRVRTGRYRAHKRLLDHTAAMIRGEPAYVLLDEQKVVFNSVLAHVAECVELGQQAAFIVRGGPGTGKSVLALNLLAELSRAGYTAHHATGSSAFTGTLRSILGSRAGQQFKYFNSYLTAEPGTLDVLICDEAHRIRRHSWNRFTKQKATDADRPQIDELLAVATVSIFFIDDLQAVRRDEIGNSDDIDRLALERGMDVHEHRLPIQFRCGGSDGFVRWVEQTLQIRTTANKLWSGDPNFDFDVVDSPQELEAMIRSRNADGAVARLTAGYCWPWSDPDANGNLPADVEIDGWAMPWNAKPEKTRLARGIPKSYLWASEPGGIDQVGCIYTAQGFEFDYVGLIWGRDLVYRPREGWIGRPEYSRDGGLKRGTDVGRFTELVKNTYRVLLSRGLRGCYVYFQDEPTRDFVLSRMDIPAVAEAAEGPIPYE